MATLTYSSNTTDSHVATVFMIMTVLIGAVLAGSTSAIRPDADAQVPPSQAVGHELTVACYQYIAKSGPRIAPSKQCCDLVKSFPASYTCELVTPVTETHICMPKVVYVGRTCGLNIPTGFVCGSAILFLLQSNRSHAEHR
ncbi:hypothetical protein LINPERHAP1_LOCUS9720 [Linum perenne]